MTRVFSWLQKGHFIGKLLTQAYFLKRKSGILGCDLCPDTPEADPGMLWAEGPAPGAAGEETAVDEGVRVMPAVPAPGKTPVPRFDPAGRAAPAVLDADEGEKLLD